MTQSSSPNYLLLASLDAARQQMVIGGHGLLAKTLERLTAVRSRCRQLPTIRTLTIAAIAAVPGFCLDPTRLTVDVSTLGITGFAADDYLHCQHHVTVELPTLTRLTSIFSIGNTDADSERLVQALQALVAQAPTLQSREPLPLAQLAHAESLPELSQPLFSPRDAFFTPQRTVPIAAAIGQPSAVSLCPYPPGIPVVLPGEVITAAAIAHLQAVHQNGGIITGASDPTLATLQIVAPP